jgi:hypothetical protein
MEATKTPTVLWRVVKKLHVAEVTAPCITDVCPIQATPAKLNLELKMI